MTSVFFDFISPYSYFLFQRINQLSDAEKQAFRFHPVLLITLLNHWGVTPPAQVKPKRLFLFRDALRYAQKNLIEFQVPHEHPFNSLLVLRMSTSFTTKNCGVEQYAVIMSLWNYIWGQGKNVDDLTALETHLNAQQLPGKSLIEASYSKESKLELKTNIDLAISNQVFGVPSLVYENEMFWGNQSWEDYLGYKKTGSPGYNTSLFHEITKNIL
jgi:2-hydroxychromene-2-carboxylate isomerase